MNGVASGLRCGLLGLVLLAGAVAPVRAASDCPGVSITTSFTLPHLRSALAHGLEGIIVALGSSSTQGAMASDLAHSYPAVLQQTLSASLPEGHVAVINRGIGGQDAAEELARLESDVLAIRPQLVIWQVGANGALRNADPERFGTLVANGVRRLHGAGADVILMDNQQSPALLAKAAGPEFDQALAHAARETGAGLFSRRALMLGWQQDGEPLSGFIAADGLHHNDRGYRCVARSLAQMIVAAVTPNRPLTAAR